MASERAYEGEAMAGAIPLTEETTCGIGWFKGAWLQKFANKKAYVFLYGLLGCIFSAAFAYFNGIITTLEKRFKIPSKTTGVITVGNDISQLFISMILSYYAGKGHRPRWIAVGLYTVVLFCIMNAFPHFLYGPGEDALFLTYEYGGSRGVENITQQMQDRHRLCQKESDLTCDASSGSNAPVIILFVAQLIAGIGGSLYYTLGISYMDDNIKRSKTPALISFSYFIRMLGPAAGYTLASFCLKFYISPSLTPKIDNKDPRWLGAWWVGWIILAFVMFIFASILGLFPKTLPRAAMRRIQSQEKTKTQVEELPASLHDMIETFKRLITNPTNMCNNFAAIFYIMGYMPYWYFLPKYIEIMYKTSASSASLITGTVGLVFSAIGILMSGIVITKYKPRARVLAMVNVLVGVISACGLISYAFLGCTTPETQGTILNSGELNTTQVCNANCHCDYVKYSPVCGAGRTFISPCHAGCKSSELLPNGTKIYTDCECVKIVGVDGTELPAIAFQGPCPVDCSRVFYIFLTVVCLLKFVGASGRASNFLISVRCVEEKDKPVAMGFGVMLMSLFAFIPSPIFFGYIMDTTCLVWGKTCTGTGNCWLYNSESLKNIMNFIAAGLVLTGSFFDFAVWYFVKNLQIFDEEDGTEMTNIKMNPDKQVNSEKVNSDNIINLEKIENFDNQEESEKLLNSERQADSEHSPNTVKE